MLASLCHLVVLLVLLSQRSCYTLMLSYVTLRHYVACCPCILPTPCSSIIYLLCCTSLQHHVTLLPCVVSPCCTTTLHHWIGHHRTSIIFHTTNQGSLLKIMVLHGNKPPYLHYFFRPCLTAVKATMSLQLLHIAAKVMLSLQPLYII